MKKLIDKLANNNFLEKEEFLYLLNNRNSQIDEYLFKIARQIREKIYGKKVFIRGLIEFTNFCKNDCYYCGIRKSNLNAQRYRLNKEDILNCCEAGYTLGFRTFVLQGGEDEYFTDDILTDIISTVKNRFPDCAITLSVGEKSYESYKKYFDAGADRYLLRHETANCLHYSKLHPKSLSLSNRKECLYNLKKIGYQVGCGFMVGSPFQSSENIVEDLCFIKELKPQMIGIGPFISHCDTPFSRYENGSVDLTLFLLGILRLMEPNVLLPSTTALGTLDPNGREKGLLAGANVVMPNLSPKNVRKKYTLYDNKICTNEEAAESCQLLKKRIEAVGYEIVIDRGDYKKQGVEH